MRPANDDKLPGVLVVHENRGLNPYIEDVARRLAVANFIAFAPDGLTSVGGYPGDDEKGARALPPASIRPRCRRISSPPRDWLKSRPDCDRQARRGRLLLRRRRGQPARRAHGLRPRRRRAVLRPAAGAPTTPRRSRRRSSRNTANSITRITGGWPAFDAALTAAGVPHEGHVYKGANHGFHNDTTPRYDQAAAEEAWKRTIDWLDKYLRA